MVIKYKEKKSKVVLVMKNGNQKTRYLTTDQLIELMKNWPVGCDTIKC